MEIKRIQLRGISQSPSDRMTDDGGVAESLNVFIDSDEVAPVLKPKDITSEALHISDIGDNEVVYIHKSPSYENYILSSVVTTNENSTISLGLIKSGGFNAFAELSTWETIRDITSIGNTLVVATNERMLYFLFKKGEYISLGEGVPEVSLSFVNIDQVTNDKDVSKIENGEIDLLPWKHKITELSGLKNTELGKEEQDFLVRDESGIMIMNKIWESYQQIIGHNLKLGCFNGPVMIRYAVKMFDGSNNFVSSPILLGGAYTDHTVAGSLLHPATEERQAGYNDRPLIIAWTGNFYDEASESEAIYNYKVDVRLRDPFKIGVYAKIQSSAIENWKDIITSVDVYVSTMANIYPDGNKSARYFETYDNGPRVIVLDPKKSENEENIEKNILSSSTFYKVKSYSIEEILSSDPSNFDVIEGDMSGESLASSREILTGVAGTGAIVPEKLSSYNNSLLAFGGGVRLPSGLYALNGQHAISVAKGTEKYGFRYHVETTSDEERIVYNRNLSFNVEAQYASRGVYTYDGEGTDILTKTWDSSPFAFISFPDSRCTKVDIFRYDIEDGDILLGVCTVEMKPHPFVPNCSYAWIGLGKRLLNLEYSNSINISEQEFYKEIAENRFEEVNNKLIVSDTDNVFSFPISRRYTFQDKVVGVAVASTALSQGQFGQFPLYVFTNEGIWVMETGTDGRFTSSRPLSREVCTNPESIVSIDQAVLFVTDRGLNILQGNQIRELSLHMNGRQYVINGSAEAIIEGTPEFSDLPNSLKFNDSFLQFIREARMAYDYSGKRVLCIKEDAVFAYLYKLDTQTWHKVSYDGYSLKKPLNSYPSCIVTANLISDDTKLSKVLDLTTYPVTAASKSEKGIIATRPFDLDNPDVLKSITDVRVRGQFPRGAVKFILQGSQDNINWYTISTLRGKSWKLFRLILLADLSPTDRISWIDIGYETRFTNKLR